jgi:hypothetical protein
MWRCIIIIAMLGFTACIEASGPGSDSLKIPPEVLHDSADAVLDTSTDTGEAVPLDTADTTVPVPDDTHDVKPLDTAVDSAPSDTGKEIAEDTGTEPSDSTQDTAAPVEDIADTTTMDTPPDVSPDTLDTAVPEDTAAPDVAEWTGSCCEDKGSPGCEVDACVEQVCEVDPYCCTVKWDKLCVKCATGDETMKEGQCVGFDATCGCEKPPPTHFQLAEHWAPVWYHDTDADNYDADYIVAFDFDGDDVSDNNWDNLEKPFADLSAVIYYSVVETDTHWFILYADFHPRDWDKLCKIPFKNPCHENDMEGAMVVVRKSDDPYGSFELLYTEAHNSLHIFHNNPAIIELSNPDVEKVGVTFENGSHPELYVESKGHGVCALYYDGLDHCKHSVDEVPPVFGGGDGVVYRYKGFSQTPQSGKDNDVGYALVSLEDTLWAKRNDICDSGCLYDKTFEYEGVSLAKAFDGDSYGEDKANPPWAWDAPDDGPVYRGDFFFRPAESMKKHVFIPDIVSVDYVYNPFLFAL